MNLYLVQLTHPSTGESFYKVGVTTHGAKARFEYGTQRVRDSDLGFREKVHRMLDGQTSMSH
jgi:hypothetical protein